MSTPFDSTRKSNRSDQKAPGEKHTFVLVHGAWVGSWLWRDVAPALRDLGHVVTTPTLTGLGERRHLQNDTTTLSTHIEDIVAHIEMEGFKNITLVSQSYGGMVATGVLSRIPEKIRSMIYLDAFVPEDRQSWVDLIPPEHAAMIAAFRDQDKSVSPLPLSLLGITAPETVAFMEPKLVDHPWRTLFEPAKVIPRPAHVRMSYVRCTANTGAHFDQILERIRKDPEVRVATIDTTHLCMLTAPEATIKAILELEGLSQ